MNYSRLLAVLLLGVLAQHARGQEDVRLMPSKFALGGPATSQRLVLEKFQGETALGEVENAQFASSDPAVVKIEGSLALAVKNGTATVTATAGDQRATTEVTVTGMDQPLTWSFRNHVESVLSKSGCNSGACHGALAGKRGFKLSLGAFDPDSDYAYITRQARARRIVLSDPGRSLVLTKPTGGVPHKGGVRFAVDSPEYRVLADWIAAGAPSPRENDPRLRQLEILPAASILSPGAKQQLI